MIKISDSCTGCFTCESICPTHCVSLAPNKYGDLMPRIDQKKCIDCGLCVKSCPINFPVQGNSPKVVYASLSKNLETYKKSTSGGISMEIAKAVLLNGGVVYGTGMDGIEAKVVRVISEEQLQYIQGSKYVHSHMNGAMLQMKSDLESGKQVVFLGVPCQVAGVRKFFRNTADGLYLVDILCHGTPSQDCLAQGISLETSEVISDVKFRDNTRYCLSLTSTSGETKKIPYRRSYWFNGFVEGYIMRETCYSCNFATEYRVGDISLGDFWGLNERNTKLEHTHGINLVLINNDNGKKLWELIRKNVLFEEHELGEALPYNHSLKHPLTKPKEYDDFCQMYANYGGRYALLNAFKKKTKYITFRRWLVHHKIMRQVLINIPKIGNKFKDYPE